LTKARREFYKPISKLGIFDMLSVHNANAAEKRPAPLLRVRLI
jgi:hypothetical protein